MEILAPLPRDDREYVIAFLANNDKKVQNVIGKASREAREAIRSAESEVAFWKAKHKAHLEGVSNSLTSLAKAGKSYKPMPAPLEAALEDALERLNMALRACG